MNTRNASRTTPNPKAPTPAPKIPAVVFEPVAGSVPDTGGTLGGIATVVPTMPVPVGAVGETVVSTPPAIVVTSATVVAAVVVVVGAICAQTGAVTMFESKVTAPLRARSRPVTFAPVVALIDVNDITVPKNTEFVPNVVELPTLQNTLQTSAPLVNATTLADAVIKVLAAWNTNTAFGSPCASSVSVPVTPSSPPAYTPATRV